LEIETTYERLSELWRKKFSTREMNENLYKSIIKFLRFISKGVEIIFYEEEGTSNILLATCDEFRDKFLDYFSEEDDDGVYVASEPDGQVEIRFMDARGVENEVEKKAEQLVKEYESKKGVDAFVSKVSDICCDVPAIEMIDGKIESYRYTRIIYDEENSSLIVIEGTAGARMGDKHIKECVSSAELSK
jgi:hypothetical protein